MHGYWLLRSYILTRACDYRVSLTLLIILFSSVTMVIILSHMAWEGITWEAEVRRVGRDGLVLVGAKRLEEAGGIEVGDGGARFCGGTQKPI